MINKITKTNKKKIMYGGENIAIKMLKNVAL